MDTRPNRFLIYTARPALLHEFIKSWAARYFYDNEKLYATEKLYAANINSPRTVETLTKLCEWKFGVHFFAPQVRRSFEQNFLSRIERARDLPPDVSANDFLEKHFPDGGAIARIFWLHCWYPSRFPIYDQHVHRAMIFIRDGHVDERYELSNYSDEKKIEQYLRYYVPFFDQFGGVSVPFDLELDGVPGRKADRALVTFGFELKSKLFQEIIAAS